MNSIVVTTKKRTIEVSRFRRYFVERLKTGIYSKVYIDCNLNYTNSIFLAGTGRSGTTWISNIINYKNEYRFIFEPFHPYKVYSFRKFRYRQYFRPENNDSEFIEPVESMLSGRLRNVWSDSLNKRFISNKRLIKDIRANLILKWIYVNFPGIPIILLLRHPCAVAYSKCKLNWDTHLEEFLAQDDLITDFLSPFKDEIKKTESTFEKHLFLWCIENYVPLKQFNEGEIHLAFYENFCANPEYEIDRLFQFLGKTYDDAVFKNLKIPSVETRHESSIITGENMVDSWRKHIPNEQVQRAAHILGLFGLDKVYSQESLPNIDNAYSMMRNFK